MTADAASETQPDGYAHYAQWKGWSGTFAPRRKEARYYAAEFRDTPLEDRDVLEVGFGDGGFMAWASAQGARVMGTEINETLLAGAHQQGYTALEASLEDLAERGCHYDVIVAFDVLEHWDMDELSQHLTTVRQLLTDGGRFVARFPNGQSPFGRAFQHGDFTHKSTLSTYKMRYLATATGLELVRVANARRVASHADPLSALRHRWLAWRRRWNERRLARLYGLPRLPLDPNLVAVLRKPRPHDSSPTKDATT